MNAIRTGALIALLGMSLTSAAGEKLPDGVTVARLEVHPETIELATPFSYAQLIVTAHTTSGDQLDATRIAGIDAPPELLTRTPGGLVRPLSDGAGSLAVTLGEHRVEIPARVSGQGDPHRVGFVSDVNPAMTKMGCNAGTCHGGAKGKNGFQLSLRGYDPIFDHRALTDDLSGRRFDRAAPDRSLMLLKATGEVPHVGGVLTRSGEPYYRILHDWIAQGVALDLDAPRVSSIEVLPKDPIVPDVGLKQQMKVIATFADGTVRDVSAEAFVETSDGEIAKVSPSGLVTTLRRGEATMLARYEGAYAASTVVVMGERSGFEWVDQPVHNWIDELVDAKLKRVKVLPSGLCSDEVFLRRIYLDLTGLPPTPEAVRAFLADPRPGREKRDALIDELIGSPAFVEHWTNKWADLMQVNRKFLGTEGASALRSYIRDAVGTNKPYNEFCYEILTGSGSTVAEPRAGYFKVLRTPEDAMENTTQLFLAIRFNCNKCHDHPFERWTQDQYYDLAAFFARIDRKEDPKYKGKKLPATAVEKNIPEVEIISDATKGEVTHERTGQVVEPRFPYEIGAEISEDVSRRERMARWITSAENPYFARSYVNRVWSYLLGVGLIEPIDDIRAGNPPSNPELLDRLTEEFVASGFDTRQLMATICRSRTYQLSIETNPWNEGDASNYARAIARRLPAEVLYDSIHSAAGSRSKLPGLPPGARAAQLLDSNVDLPGGFLDLFGKPSRESACECERSDSMMLGPVLAMVNGPVLAEAVRDPNNRIAELAARIADDDRLIEELFLAVLNRFPSEPEREAARETLHGGRADYDLLRQDYQARVEAYERYRDELDARQPTWETELAEAPFWEPMAFDLLSSKGEAKLEARPDRSVFVSGPNPTPEVYTLAGKPDGSRVTAIRLEALPDDKLPGKGPGRAPNGNFVLNEFKLFLVPDADPKAAKPVPLHKAAATFSQDGWAVAGAIDGNKQTGWAVVPRTGQAHSALFELKEPIDLEPGWSLRFVLDQQFPGKEHNLGRFRVSTTDDSQPRLADSVDPRLRDLLKIPAPDRTPEQLAELTRRHREEDARYRELSAAARSDLPPADHRALGAQDLVWALMNSPAFMFNY